MTAYGRATKPFADGSLQVEVQCINRRFLDVGVSLPRAFAPFEVKVKKWVGAKIARGQVNVTLSIKSDFSKGATLKPNLSLAKSLYEGMEIIAHSLDVPLQKEAILPLILQNRDVFIFEDNEMESEIETALYEAVTEALKGALTMKEQEGRHLCDDMLKRVGTLETLMAQIQTLAPKATARYKEKIAERVKELFSDQQEIEERVFREVALFAEKADVSEEITRFLSHLKQLNQFLREPIQEVCETRGKRIEFLIQELGREVNTLSAKAQDAEISQRAVEIKGELEKIKEQVQNIE